MKRITFTVGIGTRHGKDLAMKPILEISEARQQMAIVFTGFTETEHNGGWFDDSTGKVVYEPSVSFAVLTPNNHNKESMAVWLRDLFGQTCVMVTEEEVKVDFI